MDDRTEPESVTRQAHQSEAGRRHEADRAATGDEERAAEYALSRQNIHRREKVAEHEKEMMEIGATIKGEGEIK